MSQCSNNIVLAHDTFTVECIDMHQVLLREAPSLSQAGQRYGGITRLDCGLFVVGECVRAIVHDGVEVIGNAMSGHQ